MTDYQNALVLDNLDLVNWVIRTRISIPNRPLLTYDDFYAIGCEAICRAALKYNADTGEFAPFACRYIYNAIVDHCRAINFRMERNVEIPENEDMVVCSLMSLAIILSGVWDSGVQGAALSVSAFGSVYGGLGAKLVAIAILLFGLTTQAGWFCYYDVLLRYFLKDNIALKNKILKVFRYLYPVPGLLTILYTVSNGLPTGFVWQITDFFCAVPTMLNIICVLSLSGVYFKLVKDYKARYMGIGKIDPNFKPFFEDEVKK